MTLEIPEHVRRALRAPSYRAVIWRDEVCRNLSEILRAADVATASFESQKASLHGSEQIAGAEITRLVLEKAVELGLGSFESDTDLSETVCGKGFEDQPGTAEYALLSYWFDLHNEAYWPRFEHESSDAQRLVMGAMAVAMYSVFEQALGRLAQLADQFQPKRMSVGDFQGTPGNVVRHRTYLEKVHSLDADDRLWKRLSKLQHVRNLFAHELGRCADDHICLKAVSELPGITLRVSEIESATRDVVVDRAYLEHCRDVIGELAVALCDALQAWDRPRVI